MKPLPKFTVLLLLLVTGCQERTPSLIIPEGYVGMFGYGSLMSKKFIETGLLEKNYNGPFLSARLTGYKRSWTFAWPSTLPALGLDENYYRNYILIDGDTVYPQHLVYLNIQENTAGTVNGVLYLVPEADLPTYDAWELGYERIEVTERITDVAIENGHVFAYTALPDFVLSPDADVRRNVLETSYSNIIQDAFHYWGKDFEAEFNKNTEPVHPSIIRECQKAPWVNPPLEKIEELKARFTYSNR